ncbi:MAG: hypothetical protein SFV21_16490 [Rhodospirillaceae bacterium]|nr:hypothetical protein [Rhodospirillaceae bacterium]
MIKSIWDLRICPLTFDFAVWLAIVDCYRQVRGDKEGIDMTIRVDGFRRLTPRDRLTTDDEKLWRLKSIVLDVCELVPSIHTLAVTWQDRGPFDYPRDYLKTGIPYTAKTALDFWYRSASPLVFRSPSFAKTLLPVKSPYVTLTIRRSWHFAERNVDLNDWFKFYTYLRSEGHTVVVVPDYEDVLGEKAYEKFEWNVYVPAALDIRLRLCLYENAIMNVCSSNGPCAIMFFANTPIMQFDQLRGATISEAEWKKYNGFPVGGQFPWSRPDQRMTWKDSTFENLVGEWKNLKLQ